MRQDDYNSAGFLAFILTGIALIVVGLFLMSDAARIDESVQVASQQRAAPAMSRIDEKRAARF